ncbi:hypothetical protein ACFYVR_26305 [Rhodococcus sp. NPDC003318]|uniref:hypothetical protein n=1 Tax=Rhodococcus sp. NPDC003318 TaxID=3364503 RepID=UPI0036741E4A
MSVETIVVRDPDGGTDVSVFVDGAEVETTEYVVDAGAGHDWQSWREQRDGCLVAASQGARAALVEAFTDPPGGQYVEGRDGRDWMHGAPVLVPGAGSELTRWRSTFAAAALLTYRQVVGGVGEDIGTVISDLVADLHHLADTTGVVWESVADRAQRYHAEDDSDGV